MSIVCEQVRQLFHENGMLRGELTTVKDRLTTAEAEVESKIEQNLKLTEELDAFRKNESMSAIDVENMRIVCFVHLGYE